MRDPRDLTLDELMSHHDRNIRAKAFDLMREVCMTQLEDMQRGVPVFIEPKCLVKEQFRPLS